MVKNYSLVTTVIKFIILQIIHSLLNLENQKLGNFSEISEKFNFGPGRIKTFGMSGAELVRLQSLELASKLKSKKHSLFKKMYQNLRMMFESFGFAHIHSRHYTPSFHDYT